VTPSACQNSEVVIKVSIDNSNCKKTVKNVKFRVRRSIIACGITVRGAKKEFKDE